MIAERRWCALALACAAPWCLAGCADDLEYEVQLFFDFGADEPPDGSFIRLDVFCFDVDSCNGATDVVLVNDEGAPEQGRYRVPSGERVIYLIAREGGRAEGLFRFRAWVYEPGDSVCARWCSDAFLEGEQVDSGAAGAPRFGHEVAMSRASCGAFACR